MNELWNSPLAGEAVYCARVRGCLLGGALGDALGHPVEFSSLKRIRAANSERGVTGLLFPGDNDVARISDDAQMTLFTAEALIQARRRERLKGIGGAWALLVRWAYERRLETQRHPGPEQAAPPQSGAPEGGQITRGCTPPEGAPPAGPPATRACPGSPSSTHPIPASRSAPFGLVNSADGAFAMAARAAQITHGHPTGYHAAGALAAIEAHLVAGDSLEGAVLRMLRLPVRHSGHEETSAALAEAVDLAGQGAPAAEKAETLGEGWVAEQAFAIGVYCAFVTPTVRDALLLSVNHSGDSDSTGSICGNLPGARYGDHGLPHEWGERVEGRAQIAAPADDPAAEGVRR